jgi:hypothetical protein
MSDNNRDVGMAALGGAGAGALAAALMRGKGSTPVSDLDLIAAVQANTEAINQLITALNNLNLGGGIAQFWPTNGIGVISGRVTCIAAGTAYQMPDIEIPDDFALVVKAGNLNAGLILIASNPGSATNLGTSYSLILNESVSYRVTNANKLWVSATAANDVAIFTVERK